ncbi:MAG: class I SAM-dependent methyltransferase [Hyphomonadaceae bacterium]
MENAAVERHYAQSNLVPRVLEALAAAGEGDVPLTVERLGAFDEFHFRGREGTREAAALLDAQPSDHVLDVGAGIGGPARFLAHLTGCTVTGIDLTPDYVDAANDLTHRVGLDSRVAFRTADALALPFANGAFDKAWSLHASMNIADKAALYREIARVLKPGGRFVFYDILRGDGEAPHYPQPWASHAGISSLATPAEQRTAIEQAGLRIETWRDMGELARAFFEEQAKSTAPPAPLPTILVFLGREQAMTVGPLLSANFRERRLTLAMASALKA